MKNVSKENYSGIGFKIKALRKREGLTQVEFAKILGLSSSGFISEVESGLKMPGGEFLISLSRVFHIDIIAMPLDDIRLNPDDNDQSITEKEKPLNQSSEGKKGDIAGEPLQKEEERMQLNALMKAQARIIDLLDEVASLKAELLKKANPLSKKNGA